MILGLPLEGNAVTGMIQSDGWRDMVQAQVGIHPPEPPEGVKDRKTSGVSSAWLKENFNHCPQGAPQELVERHARVWVWHLFGGFLFRDGSGQHYIMDGTTYSWSAVGKYCKVQLGVGNTCLVVPTTL